MQNDTNGFSGPLAVVHNPKEAIKLGHDAPSGTRLDAMIDAAMSAVIQKCPVDSGQDDSVSVRPN